MEIIDIVLPSVTVFWEDLGLPKRNKMTEAQTRYLADYWDTHLEPWLTQYAKGHLNPWENGVWFADGRDAMFFKLTWAGQIPLEV